MTVATGGTQLANAIAKQFPEAVMASDEAAVFVEPDHLRDICNYLKNDDAHRYDLLNLSGRISLNCFDTAMFFKAFLKPGDTAGCPAVL